MFHNDVLDRISRAIVIHEQLVRTLLGLSLTPNNPRAASILATSEAFVGEMRKKGGNQ
jgi:hypothetical protein